jgi:hypothetical protein
MIEIAYQKPELIPMRRIDVNDYSAGYIKNNKFAKRQNQRILVGLNRDLTKIAQY